MQIYLLRSSELRMTILPARVSGQQSVDYTSENGSTQSLIRINSKDDKWYLSENKNVQISGAVKENDQSFGEVELKENAIYYLRLDGKETMILLVEPESANRKRYNLYKVPVGGIIELGQADFNQIQLKKQYVNETRHLRICYSGDIPNCVELCDEESEKRNWTYINSSRISGRKPAGIGDVIFVFGMKIVLGRGFIAINNPDFSATVRLQPKDTTSFVPLDMDDFDTELLPAFSSAPRARKEFVHQSFAIENPPEGVKEEDTPWIVMLGPTLTMAAGSLLSSIMTLNNVVSSSGSINTALPSLVTSFVMLFGSAVWPVVGKRVQKRNQVRKAAIASRDYEEYLGIVKDKIVAAIEEQRSILNENNPLLEECMQTIMQVTENLWERSQKHKDFLEVMVGKGNIPLDADFTYPEKTYHSEIGASAQAMYDVVARPHMVENVPVTLPLKGAGIVGVVGDRRNVISFTKALLIELTAMHNYEDLKIIFIYNEQERSEWEFVKWIPHLWNDERTMRYLANDPDEVKILSNYIENLRSVQQHNSAKGNNGPYYLIIAADKTLAERAQSIKELYQAPEDYNMTMLALYNERQHLPKQCSYVVDLIHQSERQRYPERYNGIAATVSDYNDITGKRIGCTSYIRYDANPEDIFIQMANIRLDSPATSKQLPTQYTFMEMFEVGKPEHLDLLRRWRENSAVSTLASPIGVDADGYYINLDIHEKAHGPHGVIAGMTGSGKSEFIISYIASLAINYSPEDVAFVLIDFKGGGMADIFKNLPHTAGLITNLDGNELKRSFMAIEHELEKRQKTFKEISEQKKISNIDIYKYQKLRRDDPSLKPLPHLILISDEFAELKQQHGDFMGQLIRIARIGRSLGVHLILATQKPDGVVDDQIKSNIRFKVCLKVQDKADSQGMIGRPDATLITNAGRFYFQVGNDEVFEYGQSPWSGALYEPLDHVKKNECDYIEILNEQGAVIVREKKPKGERPSNIPEKQIDAVVQFISEVASQNNMVAEKLWLNPLPAPKAEKKKASVYETEIVPFVLNPAIGMYDDLKVQKHLTLTIPFSTQGNTLLYGTSGSGKQEFIIRTMIEIMDKHAPEEVQFYICDFDSGSLAAFEDSAYTKTFVGAGERAAAEEMFSQLGNEMRSRRELMKMYGGNYQSYLKSSGKTLPNILLVVHNFQNLTDTTSEARPMIVQLAREGIKYGIYVLVSGTTANSIPYSMQPIFSNVYTLRQNSDDQYREIVGKTEGITPDQFRGRGLVRANGTVCEFQTSIPFEDEDNVFEAIRNFCKQTEKKWREKQGKPEPAEQKAETEAISLSSLEKKLSEAEYKAEAIPVGISEDIGDIVTYPFSKSVWTILISDEAHQREKASVLNCVKRSFDNTDEIMTIKPDDADLLQKVQKLEKLMRERANEAIAAKNAGLPLPVFPKVVVIIDSFVEVIDTLPEKNAIILVAMIQNITLPYGMFFMVMESFNKYDILQQSRYLKVVLPTSNGFLLTNEKGNQMLFDSSLTFEGSIRPPYGFVIGDGKCVRTRFMEGGDANE